MQSRFSIIVDTSYLISLADYKARAHGETALSYQKHFEANEFELFISVIVAAEFHQGQPIEDIMDLGGFRFCPYNLDDAKTTADISKECTFEKTDDNSRAQFKDDIKIIAQAQRYEADFIITQDENTMTKYVKRLNQKGLLKTRVIKLQDGFLSSHFRNGQMVLEDIQPRSDRPDLPNN